MIPKILAFTLPLGFDTLALAIAVGLRGIKPLRPAIVFAIFEGTMPAIGVLLAGVVSTRFATLAGYLGGAISIAIGIHSLREAREDRRSRASLIQIIAQHDNCWFRRVAR